MNRSRTFIIDPKIFLKEFNDKELGPLSIYTGMLLFDDGEIIGYLNKTFNSRKIECFTCPAIIIEEKIIVCYNPGIGSPAAVDIAEQMIAFGMNEIISVGTAGAISPKLNHGDIVVCSSALIKEGTSTHYIAGPRISRPDKQLTKELSNYLNSVGLNTHNGRTWTTDAPFMETIEDIMKHQSEGVITVEMEASALFTLGNYRKVPVSAIFIVSDLLGTGVWKPAFHHKIVKDNLENVVKKLIEKFISKN